MSYAEHRLEKFTNPVSALADRPQLSPAKMKAAFDACPNELREKHNGLCAALTEDKAAQAQTNEAFTARLDGFVAQAFPGEITRTMLDQPLQNEISAKAESTALQATDSRLSQTESRLTALTQVVADKSQIVFGTFRATDDETPIQINLGFKPRFLLVFPKSGVTNPNIGNVYWSLPAQQCPFFTLTESGFTFEELYLRENSRYNPYCYIAVR